MKQLRTLKPAAGPSSVTVKEAKAAARYVYRDSSTGRLVATKSTATRHGRDQKKTSSSLKSRKR